MALCSVRSTHCLKIAVETESYEVQMDDVVTRFKWFLVAV